MADLINDGVDECLKILLYYCTTVTCIDYKCTDVVKYNMYVIVRYITQGCKTQRI